MSVDPSLIERVRAGFIAAHGRAPSLVVHAPGRVNLIGEHTDYNDGFVMPCAIPRGTVVALAPRDDGEVHAAALDLDGARDVFALGPDIARAAAGEWANHVRGIAAALPAFGYGTRGMDVAMAGNVPQGAGLSSSASLGVALALGFTRLNDHDVPRATLAQMAQWSEHHYVGCACGIMDQLASACGEAGHVLLIDCRGLTVHPVPVPDHAQIVIVHSGVKRGLVDSAYNERRRQCEAAAAHFGVAALRDLELDALLAQGATLDATAWRRARHVVTENARACDAALALQQGDLPALGALMAASHASLAADFEVTVPAVDSLVELMGGVIGADGGVRMTGGGFGGCVVAVLPTSRVAALEEAVRRAHRRADGQPPLFLAVQPVAGAGVLD
jgi:galactokinase